MKENVILLTAAYRFDNLPYLAKSLELFYDKWSEYFNIYWIICKDSYNGKGDINKVITYLNQTQIKWKIYDSGTSKEKNYAGDLFNEPLKNFVELQNIDNPWVYVFDDDNLIHNNLFPTLKICHDNNYYGNKEVIVLNIKFDEGYTKAFSNTNMYLVNKYKFIEGLFFPDPSGVFIRYNIIKKYGFYSNEFLYDFNWLRILISTENELNNVITSLYYHNIGYQNVICSLHNHLNPYVNKEMFNEFENFDIDKLNIDVNISEQLDIQNREAIDITILTNDTKKKIIQLIRNEIDNIKNEINKKTEY